MKVSLSSAVKRMNDLASLLRDTNQPVELPYESELKKRAGRRSAKESQLSEDSIDRAIELWKESKEKREFSRINRRIIRLLSTVSEIARTPLFVAVLSSRFSDVSVRVLRSLLNVYYIEWKDRAELGHLETFLRDRIKSSTGDSRTLALWNHNLSMLIGHQAPTYASWSCLNPIRPIEEFFQENCILGHHSPFGSAIVRSVASDMMSMTSEFDIFNDSHWDFFRQQVLEFQSLEKDDLDAILSEVIPYVSNRRDEDNFQNIRNYLKDLVLSHPDYGDPRTYRHRFSNIDEQACRTLIAWLSEEDIGLFFELIIQTDPHKRCPFWLRYITSMQNSLVIVGEGDQTKWKKDLEQLQSSGRRFARGYGLHTSAFILDFGKYIAIEFSETGNACYVYRASEFQKYFNEIQASWIDMRDLKNKFMAIHVQRHYSSWATALEDYLSNRGIEADES